MNCNTWSSTPSSAASITSATRPGAWGGAEADDLVLAIHSNRKPPLLRVKQSCTQITLTKNDDVWHQRQIRLSPTERNRISF